MNRFALVSCVLGCALSLGACAGGSLPVTDSYASAYVGAWRVSSTSDAGTFSDYDFSDAGALTLLRSVVDGVSVDPMQSVGTVTGAASGGVCVFARSWYSAAAELVVVGGDCTDGVERDVALAFGAEHEGVSEVSAESVDGSAAWMRPASWRFQHCDVHACD